MTLYDTNVWVAYFNRDDSLHAKAAKLFAEHEQRTRIALPEYVALEVATVLAVRRGKAEADHFLDYALDNEQIEILFSSPSTFQAAVRAFQKQPSKALSFVDAALIVLGKEHTVITFDKALQKALKAKF